LCTRIFIATSFIATSFFGHTPTSSNANWGRDSLVAPTNPKSQIGIGDRYRQVKKKNAHKGRSIMISE
jgi:hypothetical protein